MFCTYSFHLLYQLRFRTHFRKCNSTEEYATNISGQGTFSCQYLLVTSVFMLLCTISEVKVKYILPKAPESL